MPLIPSDHMHIDINEVDLSGLLIKTSQFDNRVTDLFKIAMLCKDGAASLICSASCKCQFVLRTNRGLISSSSEEFLFPNNKVLYFMLDDPFNVIALSVVGRAGGFLSLIELLPGLLNEKDHCMKLLAMECVQVDWKAAERFDQFSFSATLHFHQLPTSVTSTQISCQIFSAGNELERRALGDSFCSRFRIAELVVPNPQFHGPNCNLLFVAIHLTRGGTAVAESRLRIIYAENI